MEVPGHFIAETRLFSASGHDCPVIVANADRPTNKSIRTLRLQISFPSRQEKDILLVRTASIVENLTASWTYAVRLVVAQQKRSLQDRPLELPEYRGACTKLELDISRACSLIKTDHRLHQFLFERHLKRHREPVIQY